eukprot:6214421-Pleurochrysis_carterae.AAC.4
MSVVDDGHGNGMICSVIASQYVSMYAFDLGFCLYIAWVARTCADAYSRSARAPLPKLLESRARDGCRYTVSAPPRATAQACPSTRARARKLPTPDGLYFYFRPLLSAWMVALVAIP